MMKKRVLLVLLFIISLHTSAFAYKGDNFFLFQCGYENFSRFPNDGYNFSVNFKHYLNERTYAIANFHAGLSNMERKGEILSTSDSYYDLNNKQRDYMLGFGLGHDIFRKNRHVIYLQTTVGIGVTDLKRENIELPEGNVNTIKDNNSTFALSFSTGYDYQLTDWLTIGVNYTGYQINYYKNTCNLRLGIKF